MRHADYRERLANRSQPNRFQSQSNRGLSLKWDPGRVAVSRSAARSQCSLCSGRPLSLFSLQARLFSSIPHAKNGIQLASSLQTTPTPTKLKARDSQRQTDRPTKLNIIKKQHYTTTTPFYIQTKGFHPATGTQANPLLPLQLGPLVLFVVVSLWLLLSLGKLD